MNLGRIYPQRPGRKLPKGHLLTKNHETWGMSKKQFLQWNFIQFFNGIENYLVGLRLNWKVSRNGPSLPVAAQAYYELNKVTKHWWEKV